MEVKLVVASGKSAGREIPVTGPKFFIGRSEECHLRPHSDQVSRHHCVILIEEALVAVRDLGSKNGTYVNGERVRTEHDLKTGDHLRVGPLDFEVHIVIGVGGKKKPKVKSIQEAAARTIASGAPGADEEDADVANWLMDDEEDARMSDTGTLSDVATDHVTTGPSADVIPEPAPEPSQEDTTKGPPGKFQAPKKPLAEDSRQAAADVLREFFKRK
jgi:pSer/pThr/pTyr-binding forkhead associated (FHA) protein